MDNEELLKELIKQIKIMNMDPEYWELVMSVQDVPTTVIAGDLRVLQEEYERGKLIALGIFLDNKDTTIEMRFDDELFLRRTVEEIYDSGVVGYNPTTFWIAKYDTTNNSYAIWLTPALPKDYFGSFKCQIIAPPLSNVSYMYTVYRYRLKKEAYS